MSDTITIITSDTPPVSLPASRAVLVSTARFSPTCSPSPSTKGQDNSVTVAETKQDLKVFLAVLAGEGRNKGGVLEKLDEIGWEKLAKLSDKYDSQITRRVIEAKMWELDALGTPSPLHSFTMATFLLDR